MTGRNPGANPGRTGRAAGAVSRTATSAGKGAGSGDVTGARKGAGAGDVSGPRTRAATGARRGAGAGARNGTGTPTATGGRTGTGAGIGGGARPRKRIAFLDVGRAFGALLVVYSQLSVGWMPAHDYAPGWIRMPDIAGRFALRLDSGDLGEISVPAFFLISGFVISAVILREGARRFAVRRALRVWPVLVVAVLVTLGALALGGHPLGTTRPAATDPGSLLAALGLANYVLTPNHVLLGVGWTLAVEVLFYLLALAFLPLLRRLAWLALFLELALVALVLTMCRAFGPEFTGFAALASFLPAIVVGQIIWTVRSHRLTLWQGIGMGGLAWLVYVAAGKLDLDRANDAYNLALAYAVLLFGIGLVLEPRLRPVRWISLLADRSYEIFLLQAAVLFPVLDLLFNRVPFGLALLAGLVALAAAVEIVHRLVSLPSRRLAVFLTTDRGPDASPAPLDETDILPRVDETTPVRPLAGWRPPANPRDHSQNPVPGVRRRPPPPDDGVDPAELTGPVDDAVRLAELRRLDDRSVDDRRRSADSGRLDDRRRSGGSGRLDEPSPLERTEPSERAELLARLGPQDQPEPPSRRTRRDPDPTPEPARDAAPNRPPEQAPERSGTRTPERSGDRTPQRSAERAPERAVEPVVEPAWPTPDPMPERMPEPTSGPMPGSGPDFGSAPAPAWPTGDPGWPSPGEDDEVPLPRVVPPESRPRPHPHAKPDAGPAAPTRWVPPAPAEPNATNNANGTSRANNANGSNGASSSNGASAPPRRNGRHRLQDDDEEEAPAPITDRP